jgi:hypothetical protein
MLEPGLKVAGAGLDNSTWVEAIRREPRERGLVEIVEGGETMLARWTNVDVRAVALRYLSRGSLSRTAAAEMLSSPGSIPRSFRTHHVKSLNPRRNLNASSR